MARLDKTELKSIIKECLIEILAEGLAPDPSDHRAKKRMTESFGGSARKKNSGSKTTPRRKSHLDSIRMGDATDAQARKRANITNQKVSKITSDPMMQDILKDTAATTLVEQGTSSTNSSMPSHASRPADKAAQLAGQHDPTELFAESAQNWATLAFS